MRWADTDSDDSDDEFQTHPSRSGSAMGNLIVNPQVRIEQSYHVVYIASTVISQNSYHFLHLFDFAFSIQKMDSTEQPAEEEDEASVASSSSSEEEEDEELEEERQKRLEEARKAQKAAQEEEEKKKKEL